MLFSQLIVPAAVLSAFVSAAPQFRGGRPLFGRPGGPSPPSQVVGQPATPISNTPIQIPTTPASSCIFPSGARPDFSCLNKTGCPAPPASVIEVPAGMAAASGTVNFAMLGRGVQNYTCTNGTFVAGGAVAKLYDINCLSAVADAGDLTGIALDALSTSSSIPHTIDHYFIPNGAEAAPKFALASNGGATFNTYSVTTNVPSEDPSNDVASLLLSSTGAGPAGALGSTAYRLFTAGGQPPTSCAQAGQKLSVQYAALYYFVG